MWRLFTHTTAVSEFADPDVVCATSNIENFQRLIADDSYVVAVSSYHRALRRNNRPATERYNAQHIQIICNT